MLEGGFGKYNTFVLKLNLIKIVENQYIYIKFKQNVNISALEILYRILYKRTDVLIRKYICLHIFQM